MYVSISEDTAVEVIERLEKRVRERDCAIDARWDNINELSQKNAQLAEELADIEAARQRAFTTIVRLRDELEVLRAAQTNPERECQKEHYLFSKITLIKFIRAVMGVDLLAAKNLADAAFERGEIKFENGEVVVNRTYRRAK